MEDDGVSLRTFYKAAERAPTSCSLLIFKDANGKLFGGYAGAAWERHHVKETKHYYGGAESFVFTVDKGEHSLCARARALTWPSLTPFARPPDAPRIYDWTGTNDFFSKFSPVNSHLYGKNHSLNSYQQPLRVWSLCTPTVLSTSESLAMGGGGSFAWAIDSSFRHGDSGDCETFGSPCLASQEQFQLLQLEVGFPATPTHQRTHAHAYANAHHTHTSSGRRASQMKRNSAVWMSCSLRMGAQTDYRELTSVGWVVVAVAAAAMAQ